MIAFTKTLVVSAFEGVMEGIRDLWWISFKLLVVGHVGKFFGGEIQRVSWMLMGLFALFFVIEKHVESQTEDLRKSVAALEARVELLTKCILQDKETK